MNKVVADEDKQNLAEVKPFQMKRIAALKGLVCEKVPPRIRNVLYMYIYMIVQWKLNLSRVIVLHLFSRRVHEVYLPRTHRALLMMTCE